MAPSDVTKDGQRGLQPDREALVGAGPAVRRRRHTESVVAAPQPRSYYGLPVLNKPVWEPLDIAGYLFLGGLAGSSSALAAAAAVTGRPALARPLKVGAAGAISLSLAALVHDLGRPARFYNMLRVFKPTSPMNVGSWILSVYGPAAIGAAAAELLSRSPLRDKPVARIARSAGPVATVAAGVVGPAVATYTAVLVSDTAVPAWHGAYREMPFLFAGSACSAGAGLGLITTPLSQSGPARRLAPVAAVAELVAAQTIQRRTGMVGENYEQGKAGKLLEAAEALTAAGLVGSVLSRRSRLWSALSGACLVAGSAFSRFGIFHAGVQSAMDPRYTVEPQKAAAAP